MDNLLKDMGKRIFDRRKQLNMTQETLAELAHVTPQTISTAELGQKAMRPETILKVCDALNISTEYLLRGIITETDSSLLMVNTPPETVPLDRTNGAAKPLKWCMITAAMVH